jgi:hypothetical protein
MKRIQGFDQIGHLGADDAWDIPNLFSIGPLAVIIRQICIFADFLISSVCDSAASLQKADTIRIRHANDYV